MESIIDKHSEHLFKKNNSPFFLCTAQTLQASVILKSQELRRSEVEKTTSLGNKTFRFPNFNDPDIYLGIEMAYGLGDRTVTIVYNKEQIEDLFFDPKNNPNSFRYLGVFIPYIDEEIFRIDV